GEDRRRESKRWQGSVEEGKLRFAAGGKGIHAEPRPMILLVSSGGHAGEPCKLQSCRDIDSDSHRQPLGFRERPERLITRGSERERPERLLAARVGERETGASAHCEGQREGPERLLTARVRERDRSVCSRKGQREGPERLLTQGSERERPERLLTRGSERERPERLLAARVGERDRSFVNSINRRLSTDAGITRDQGLWEKRK
ncbi:hypothetical protein KUCAC02_004828, partial [Chaenocephalus aceratus]